MKVAVIMPYRNVNHRVISLAAGSVLSQTHKDLTLYMVRDGELGAEVDDKRVVHLGDDANLGWPARTDEAMRVIATSDAEWIAFVDADDVISPNMLRGLVRQTPRADFFGVVRGDLRMVSVNAELPYSAARMMQDALDGDARSSLISGMTWEGHCGGTRVAALWPNIPQVNEVAFCRETPPNPRTIGADWRWTFSVALNGLGVCHTRAGSYFYMTDWNREKADRYVGAVNVLDEFVHTTPGVGALLNQQRHRR